MTSCLGHVVDDAVREDQEHEVSLVCLIDRMAGPRTRRLQHLGEKGRRGELHFREGRGVRFQDPVHAMGFSLLVVPSRAQCGRKSGGTIVNR